MNIIWMSLYELVVLADGPFALYFFLYSLLFIL